MSAHHPLTPMKAVEFLESAGVQNVRRLLADHAAAGLTKSYASMVVTIDMSGRVQSVRGATLSVELWRRIARDALVDDVWSGGTVRLPGDPTSGDSEVEITGISFRRKCLERLADDHQGMRSEATGPIQWFPVPDAAQPESPERSPAASAPKSRRTKGDISAIPAGALVATMYETEIALSLKPTKIRELLDEGALVRKKFGKALRIEVESIRAYAAKGG